MSILWVVFVMLSHSVVSDSATPWTVARQAPLSMGFSRQEYWRGLQCPSPGNLPNPGIKPTSLASPTLVGRFFTTEPPGKLSEYRKPIKKTYRPRRSSENQLQKHVSLPPELVKPEVVATRESIKSVYSSSPTRRSSYSIAEKAEVIFHGIKGL